MLWTDNIIFIEGNLFDKEGAADHHGNNQHRLLDDTLDYTQQQPVTLPGPDAIDT